MMMNRVKTVSINALAVCIAFVLSGCFCLKDEVFIPDPAFRLAVRLELMKPLGCITKTDVLEVTELHLEGMGIESLEGLQYFFSLRMLNLSNNNISSIAQLHELSQPNRECTDDEPCLVLEHLDISNNAITDIQPLTGLLDLSFLDLSFNNINLWVPLVSVVANGFPGGGTFVVDEASVMDAGTEGAFLPGFQDVENARLERDGPIVNRIIELTSAAG